MPDHRFHVATPVGPERDAVPTIESTRRCRKTARTTIESTWGSRQLQCERAPTQEPGTGKKRKVERKVEDAAKQSSKKVIVESSRC